jgi:hypothetical protein
MAKDKFRKRKDLRRNIRGEMTKRGIVGREIAERLNITPGAVSKGCATSPRIIEALIEAGVPARMFGKIPPSPPLPKGGDFPSPQPDGGRDARPTGEGGE